ncbi:hypothetical protein GCM10010502_52300 [Kitasatospora aureofaciens]|uniref:Uncharacterized protein n=1 Tax=Kitasatospora aureofaciens TaxID=1894 RepID=A0A8H9LSN1_KITAU|nr:hypothetical protein GCM10010502_52300 [Kitasatospora aureofaciens]
MAEQSSEGISVHVLQPYPGALDRDTDAELLSPLAAGNEHRAGGPSNGQFAVQASARWLGTTLAAGAAATEATKAAGAGEGTGYGP